MTVQCHTHSRDLVFPRLCSASPIPPVSWYVCFLVSSHTPLNCILCFVCFTSLRCISHSSLTPSNCSHSQTCLVPFLSKFCCHPPGQHASIYFHSHTIIDHASLSHHAAVSYLLTPHHLSHLTIPTQAFLYQVFFPYQDIVEAV